MQKAKRGNLQASEQLKRENKLKIWTELELQGLNVYLRSREDPANWITLPKARHVPINGNEFLPMAYAHIGNETDPFYLFAGRENDETQMQQWVFAMINEAFQPLFNTRQWERWEFPTRMDIRRQYPFRA